MELTPEDYALIPAPAQALYTLDEGRGMYVLRQAGDGPQIQDPDKLLNTITATRGERDEYKRQAREAAKSAQQLNAELEAARAEAAALQAKIEEQASQPASAASDPQMDQRIADELAKTQQAYEQTRQQLEVIQTASETRIAQLGTALERQMIETEFMRTMRSIDPDSEPGMLLHVARERARMVEDEENPGVFKTVILDDQGRPAVRLSDDNSGSVDKTMGDLVAELRDHPTWGRAFGATAASSAGKKLSGMLNPGEDNPFLSPEQNLGRINELFAKNPAEAARLQALAKQQA